LEVIKQGQQGLFSDNCATKQKYLARLLFHSKNI